MTQANDSITVTPGSGATVATHLVSGKEHQVVVLADQSGTLDPIQASTLMVTGTAATAAGVTVSLPAIAGQFHYITSIEVVLYNAAARTTGVTPVTMTTTNLPGSPAFTYPSAGAIGTVDRHIKEFAIPLKSSTVNTATTLVAPATTSVLWRINVSYYTAA